MTQGPAPGSGESSGNSADPTSPPASVAQAPSTDKAASAASPTVSTAASASAAGAASGAASDDGWDDLLGDAPSPTSSQVGLKPSISLTQAPTMQPASDFDDLFGDGPTPAPVPIAVPGTASSTPATPETVEASRAANVETREVTSDAAPIDNGAGTADTANAADVADHTEASAASSALSPASASPQTGDLAKGASAQLTTAPDSAENAAVSDALVDEGAKPIATASAPTPDEDPRAAAPESRSDAVNPASQSGSGHKALNPRATSTTPLALVPTPEDLAALAKAKRRAQTPTPDPQSGEFEAKAAPEREPAPPKTDPDALDAITRGDEDDDGDNEDSDDGEQVVHVPVLSAKERMAASGPLPAAQSLSSARTTDTSATGNVAEDERREADSATADARDASAPRPVSHEKGSGSVTLPLPSTDSDALKTLAPSESTPRLDVAPGLIAAAREQARERGLELGDSQRRDAERKDGRERNDDVSPRGSRAASDSESRGKDKDGKPPKRADAPLPDGGRPTAESANWTPYIVALTVGLIAVLIFATRPAGQSKPPANGGGGGSQQVDGGKAGDTRKNKKKKPASKPERVGTDAQGVDDPNNTAGSGTVVPATSAGVAADSGADEGAANEATGGAAPGHDDGAPAGDDDGAVADSGGDTGGAEPHVDPIKSPEVPVTNSNPTSSSPKRGEGDPRAVPAGTPEPNADAFRKIPVSVGDGPPVGGVGESGIHIDEIAAGPTLEGSSCVDDPGVYLVGTHKVINICVRVVHARGADEELTVLWQRDGKTLRRSKLRIPSKLHAYKTATIFSLRAEYVGTWVARIMSGDAELATMQFEVAQ